MALLVVAEHEHPEDEAAQARAQDCVQVGGREDGVEREEQDAEEEFYEHGAGRAAALAAVNYDPADFHEHDSEHECLVYEFDCVRFLAHGE